MPVFFPYNLAFRLIGCGPSDIHSCRVTIDCGGAVNGKHIGALTELVADRSWPAKEVVKLPVNMSSLFWFIIIEIRSSDLGDYENCCLLTSDTAQPLEVNEMNNSFQLGVAETSFLSVYEVL